MQENTLIVHKGLGIQEHLKIDYFKGVTFTKNITGQKEN